jgi:3-keto-disaccharide hydrolase
MRVSGIILIFAAAGWAQQPAGAPKRMPNLATLIQPLPESGFRPIFDGKSMKGWDGDPNFWRVEAGALVGQTAADKQPKQNTFLIWRGGTPSDFELRLEYRLTGFNSGIQIRSVELPDLKWAMKGYQADMDGEQRFTGQFYEERGRGFLAMRGQFTYVGDGGKPGLVASLGDNAALKEFIKGSDWNDLHLIARGNTLIQILNGHVMSMVIDEDKAGRKMDGLIGIQAHLGPPMKIEVRNIRLKEF